MGERCWVLAIITHRHSKLNNDIPTKLIFSPRTCVSLGCSFEPDAKHAPRNKDLTSNHFDGEITSAVGTYKQTTSTRRSTFRPFLFGVFFKVQALNYGSLLIARSCLSSGGPLNPSGADCWRNVLILYETEERDEGREG